MNINAYTHPTVKRNIRHSIWLAKLEAYKTKRTASRKVLNRKGEAFLAVTVSYWDGYITISDKQARIISYPIMKMMGIPNQHRTIW